MSISSATERILIRSTAGTACWPRDRSDWASCLTPRARRPCWARCGASPASVWLPAVSPPTPGSSAVSSPAAGAGSLSQTPSVWRLAVGGRELELGWVRAHPPLSGRYLVFPFRRNSGVSRRRRGRSSASSSTALSSR